MTEGETDEPQRLPVRRPGSPAARREDMTPAEGAVIDAAIEWHDATTPIGPEATELHVAVFALKVERLDLDRRRDLPDDGDDYRRPHDPGE